MAKIRILQVCNQLGIGGTEKTIQVFSKYLDRSRFEVFVCGLRAGGPRVQELERLGIPVIVQPCELNTLIEELKIDVYHIYRAGEHEPGTLPRKRQGWPKIVETNVFDAIDPVGTPVIDAHVFFSRCAGTITWGNMAGFMESAMKCSTGRSTSTSSHRHPESSAGRSAGAAGLTTSSR